LEEGVNGPAVFQRSSPLHLPDEGGFPSAVEMPPPHPDAPPPTNEFKVNADVKTVNPPPGMEWLRYQPSKPKHEGKIRPFIIGYPPTEGTVGGLEEQTSLRQKFQIFDEGRLKDGSIFVIPAETLHAFSGLEEILAQLPPSFSSSIVVWGRLGAGLEERNPGLRFLASEDPSDLAVYLAGLEEIRKVNLLSEDLGRARSLQSAMRRFGIGVERIPSRNLSLFFEGMGISTSVSQQVGLEELSRQILTKQST